MVTVKPAISILMTSYNHSRFIGSAIESVVRQTRGDWELLILDDASTDDSVSIIKRYLSNTRIRFYKNKANQGYVKNLIKLVRLAQAPIAGILDSDDALMPMAVEKVLDVYENNPDIGLVYTQNHQCDENLIPEFLGFSAPIPRDKTSLHVNTINHFRTFKLGCYNKTSGYDPGMINGEDIDLVYKLEEICQAAFVDEPLYLYRVLKRSQTHSWSCEMENRAFTALAKLNAYQRRLSISIPNLTKIELSEVLFFGILTSLLARRINLTLKFNNELFKINPFFFLRPKFYCLLFKKAIKVFKLKFYQPTLRKADEDLT